MHARDAERTAAKPITDMAEKLYDLVRRQHSIEVITLVSSRHPEWDKIRGNDDLVAPRYEVLSARENADKALCASLINARYGHHVQLGDQFIPALKELVNWRRENPITGNPQDALATQIAEVIQEAEQMQFVEKAQARAESLSRSGLNL
jgi:hypothetical protein